jgi:hypothetical protein
MRANLKSGSVRGVRSNPHPYRDLRDSKPTGGDWDASESGRTQLKFLVQGIASGASRVLIADCFLLGPI